MNPYPHIDSVYKRDERGKFLLREYSRPEFEYLEDKPWQWTEKIDGTNIRVMWEPNDGIGSVVKFGGKTDNAQIPAKLVAWLNSQFTPAKFFEASLEDALCLYGEGYGAGIQKGGGNYSPTQKFILFDVKIGDWWLERENVVDIANKLGIDVVPVAGTDSLEEMIENVSAGVDDTNISQISPTAHVEGYVGTPLIPLFNRKGGRVITKVKYKDFADAKNL